MPATNAPSTQREQLILDLFPRVKQLRYAFLNYHHASLTDIPPGAELELLIDRKEVESWKDILSASEGLQKLRYRETSFACYADLFLEDGGNLSLVLLYQAKERSYVFLPAKPVLTQVNRNAEGVWLASPEHALEYIMLRYFLRGTAVPEVYLIHFFQQNKVIQASVRRYFLNKYQLDVQEVRWDSPQKYQKKLWKMVVRNKANRSWKGVKLLLNYLVDLWREPALTTPLREEEKGENSRLLAYIQRLSRAIYA
jgi:hypothetical protein